MKLLVSVRNVAEARVALEAGVDLLDIKEPRKGPLGAASPRVWREIRELADGRVPVGAALGELSEWNDWVSRDRSEDFDSLAGFAYAKIGLENMAGAGNWTSCWPEFRGWLPSGVQAVAVAYADWRQAAAPQVEQVLDRAEKLGWSALLIDTFDKQQGGLLNYLQLTELNRITASARDCGMLTVLAGSLDLETIRALGTLEHRPDYVAVRGAVCRGGREAELDRAKIEAIRQVLDS